MEEKRDGNGQKQQEMEERGLPALIKTRGNSIKLFKGRFMMFRFTEKICL